MQRSYRSAVFLAAAASMAVFVSSPTSAQSRRATEQEARQSSTVTQVPSPAQEKCLRALNGECTNPAVVEAARLRAMVIPAVTVSYFGTPAGSIGGDYIPFERIFQDNPIVYGLPTNTFIVPGCCVRRTR